MLDSTTADHPPPEPGTEAPATQGTFAPTKRVVKGKGTHFVTETRWLLHQRLRAVSLVLAAGFGLFFIRSLFLHKVDSLANVFYGLLLLMLLVSLGLLSSRWTPALERLRQFEIVLFALIVIFFMAAQYNLMLRGLREHNPTRLVSAANGSVLWMLMMIFTYAIFIPNHWSRAAKVVVPMALAPMAVPWVLGFVHPEFYEIAIHAASFEKISENSLFLVLGALTAIFGTHTINTLRIEAFEAKVLNQYRLGQKLGGGGMGEVFLAEHQLLKRPCAIKLIRHDLAGNPRIFARFEREVRAAAQLSHWNTIEIFDYGRNDDGAFYYVMEYLPGLSLAELVESYGPMPPARVIYLLRQACDALREAHDSGLIHRDIKPANLMAAYRGGHYDVSKLLDFGLVKTLSEDESVQLSREGNVPGSPLYMAPEQVMQSSPPDRRTDIYGLGAVAYFTLTGRPPFLGDNPMAVMVAHARDPVRPPSELRPEIPADLESIVLKCLAKNPDDRYPDTATLAEALETCADAPNWSPRHAAEWWQNRPAQIRAQKAAENERPHEDRLAEAALVGSPLESAGEPRTM
jgi:serine/threonine-protein kinase